MDKNMSKKFIELVSEFDSKYVIPIDEITTVYQESEDSELTDVYFGNEDHIRTKTPYNIITDKLFE